MNCILDRFKPQTKITREDIQKAIRDSKAANDLVKEILKVDEDLLSEKRLGHTIRVVQAAIKIARHFELDVNRVAIAAAFHDMAKELSTEDHEAIAEAFDLPGKYVRNRALGHGRIAAEIARELWNVDDEKILNAISYHTTGRAGMGPEEKVVFLADLIEPGRDYPRIEEIRKVLWEKGIDQACIAGLQGVFAYIRNTDGGSKIDDDGLEAYRWLTSNKK